MSRKPTLAILVCLGATLALGGCASSGQHLIRDPRGYEEGLAVHYSDRLHGRPTANGERYDRNLLTAAHRYLPFGTIVRVTRLSDERAVEVRINDRGPYDDPARIIDLSMAAAVELGIVRPGMARVRLEVVRAPPATGRPAARQTSCPCAASGFGNDT